MRASWFLLVLGLIATAFALDGPAYKDRFLGVPPPPIPPCKSRKQKWQKILEHVTVYNQELKARADPPKGFIAWVERHNLHNDNIHLARTYIRCCPASRSERHEMHGPWKDGPANEGFHLPWRSKPPPALKLRSLEAEVLEAGRWEEHEHKGLEAREDVSSPEVCERDVGRLRAEVTAVLAAIPALEWAAEEFDIRYYQDIPALNGTAVFKVRGQADRLKTNHGWLARAVFRCCPMVDRMGPMPGALKPYPSVPSQPPWPQPMDYHNYAGPPGVQVIDPVDS